MRPSKEIKRSGFTMIEAVITIAVIAILAAVLIPLISQNIQSARHARAGSDVSTIGKAILQFRQDTARWPVWFGGGARLLLFGDLDATNDGIPDTSAIPPGWDAIPQANRLSLNYHLLGYNFAVADNVHNGPSPTGLPSWNGPYITDIKPDPWGNPYVVNAQWLGGNGSVYVLSAGPGRPASIETPFNGSPPADSDDITFRLQ
jgi:prepilin-type N-terminal cleavage/methylation domain-containing protein